MSIAVSVLYRLKESSVFFGKRNNDKNENLDKTGIRFVFACYLGFYTGDVCVVSESL